MISTFVQRLLLLPQLAPNRAGLSRATAIDEAARLAAISAAVREGEILSPFGEPSLAATYGEITPLGFQTLCSELKLGSSDVFADLGSGTGKAVCQAVEEYAVASAAGVELEPCRHARALALRDSLPKEQAERVAFIEGDCTDAQIWNDHLGDVTVVYAASLLFPRDLMDRLAPCLEGAPKLRAVATLRPFRDGLRGFAERGSELRCEMSWTANTLVPSEPDGRHPGCPVYVYLREPSRADVALMRERIDEMLL
tara:strand:+ start:630 stop:1391 length:762 start_codon:yes stop_codon:yes gene_type:complete